MQRQKVLYPHVPMPPEVEVADYLKEEEEDSTEAVALEILEGLLGDTKQIPSRLFYDERGSLLFEEITRLPEYYIPRLEKGLIKQAAVRLQGSLHELDLVELGSGDCSKISLLLSEVPPQQMRSIRYIPVDVSYRAAVETAKNLARLHPQIHVQPVVADFMRQLHVIPQGTRRLICLFGSTIGNLNREASNRFCARLRSMMGRQDLLLMGMDMVKDPDVLTQAYNDNKQVTAQFNRNILSVVNRLTGTSFNPDQFSHVAVYNEDAARIEMYLEAQERVETGSPYCERAVVIKRGERIHTENSHKFTDTQIRGLGERAGLTLRHVYSDENRWFSLVEFVPKENP